MACQSRFDGREVIYHFLWEDQSRDSPEHPTGYVYNHFTAEYIIHSPFSTQNKKTKNLKFPTLAKTAVCFAEDSR